MKEIKTRGDEFQLAGDCCTAASAENFPRRYRPVSANFHNSQQNKGAPLVNCTMSWSENANG